MTQDTTPTSLVRKMSAIRATEVTEASGTSGGRFKATDARLQAAVAHVAKGECEVLSLDVFDTLMWRKLPEPGSAPHLLGARLAAEGLLAPNIDGSAFAALRGRAEALARKERNGRGTEVTLRDICARFPNEALRGITLDGLMDREVELERTLLVPDLDVVELVRWAGERGVRVVCVSDTYFSEIHLRSFLAAAPAAALRIERIFTSSTRGVATRDGLWRIVLDEIGVQAAGVVHVGCGPVGIEDPAERGDVRTVDLERLPEALARIIRAEERHLVDPLSPYHGDFGLTALRSKVLNRVECLKQPPELRPSWVFGAASLGPPLAGFAEWVVHRAGEARTSRVLCMMPTGLLMARMVNVAASSVGAPVEAETIPLSAQVCAQASVSAELGGRVVRCLEQIRPRGEHRLVLVDVGWGAGQPLLDGLLRRSGSELRTSELSLIAAHPVSEPLPGRHGFLSGPGRTPTSVDALARSPDVLRRICMPERGSQVGLDSMVEPVLESMEDAPMEWAKRETVRKGILAFQREWVRYRASAPNAQVPLHEHGQDRLRSVLVQGLSSAADSPSVGRQEDGSPGSQGLEPLMSPVSARRRLLDEARRVACGILPGNDRS